MSKISWKGSALLAPLPPVLVSVGTFEASNLITIGWTGITNTQPPKTYISVRSERHSYNIIKERGEFVINLTTQNMVRAVDLCGVKSGANCDKFALCGLTREPASKISCPMVSESPLSLECVVTDALNLGSHTMFMADIVAVNVDEKYIDSSGKLHLSKAGLLAYAHGEYFALGKSLGTFGYSVMKKSTQKRRNGGR